MLRIALILALALALSGCPGNKSNNSKSGARVFRVKGDPNIFIKDSALNGLRALPAAIAKTSAWEFDISGFQEENAETDVDEAVKQQTPGESNVPKSYTLQAREVNDQLIVEGEFKRRMTHFLFSRGPNGWVPYSFRLGPESGVFGSSPFEVVHTSILPDRSAFTLLVRNKTPGQRRLYSFTFVRSKPLVTRIGDKLFEFLFGKGVKVGWSKRKARVLQICGALPDPLPRLVQEEAARWTKALEGRLQFTAEKKASCPPFSDLNTQTFVFTTDWIEIQGDAAVEAQTMNIAGPGREELIDSDIFYLLGEYQEALQLNRSPMKILDPATLALPKLQLAVRKTSLHEIGHFLGLHHQFNPAVPSIMSYAETNENKLYDYDVKAVQHLYDD